MSRVGAFIGQVFTYFVLGLIFIFAAMAAFSSTLPDSSGSVETEQDTENQIIQISPSVDTSRYMQNSSYGEDTWSRTSSSAPFVEHVYPDYEGADVYGGIGIIRLDNNINAKNPTYAEVIKFLKTDRTDKNNYSSGYVCADYARDVHNHAEAAGLKCGFVIIDFRASDVGHACNAFDTTDKGRIYIDCTSFDSIIPVISSGSDYTPEPLNSDSYCEPVGVVQKYRVYF